MGPEDVTGRRIHQVSLGTHRALIRNILIILDMAAVFFLSPTLNLQPMRGTFIEKGFH
jgi:hypothetical protein